MPESDSFLAYWRESYRAVVQQYGMDYARDNPELVRALMMAMHTQANALKIASAIDRLAKSLRAIADAARER